MKAIYVQTLYSLLLALIILDSDQDDIVIFYDHCINLNYKKYLEVLENSIEIKKINETKRILVYLKTYKYTNELLAIIKQKKIEKIYIQDHLVLQRQFFLNNISECYVIEDGTVNYNLDLIKEKNIKEKKEYKRDTYNLFFKIKLKIVNKIRKIHDIFGMSEKIKKIYLTGILPVPEIIKNKVEIVNIKKRWEKLSTNRQKEILKIFNISLESIEYLKNDKNKILLLTQPLSEDGILTEEEKIQIYKLIIRERNIKRIYIKPHPREKTNYKEVLKNCDFEIKIIDNTFPIELLLFSDIKFEKTITLFSTAALNFKKFSNVEFLGTKNYPKLLKVFGNIEM